jgi:hypothetical protein
MCEKGFKNTKLKGLKLGGQLYLTQTEKEILQLLTKEYMTPVKIANYRATSLNAVYKVIRNLAKKGVYNTLIKEGLKSQCTPRGTIKNEKTSEIRLHAQEFNIKLLYKSKEYDKIKKNSNLIYLDDNTIRLFENSLEIYSGKSFICETPQEAVNQSFTYWNRFFNRLENYLKILIVKDRYKNINLVKSHFSLINNELAEQCNTEKIKIKVKSTQDNKVWFEIDNSFNLNEAETIHPQTSKKDMQEIVQPFFNDLRDKNSLLPSEITQAVLKTQNQLYEVTTGLNLLIKFLNPSKEQDSKEQDSKENLNYVG